MDNQQTGSGDPNSQESVYARNRAIYEASLAQTGDAVNGNGSGRHAPAFNFDPNAAAKKQSRPRSPSPQNRANQVLSQDAADPDGPARKKLVRAGDLQARNGSQEPSGGPITGSQESLREQIAKAKLPPSVTPTGSPGPFSAQVPNSSTPAPFLAQPQLSPRSNGTNPDLERIVEIGAVAFVQKNPNVPIEHVKQALRHSRGQFDQNFTTAMKLLMTSGTVSQDGTQRGSKSPVAATATMSPHGVNSALPNSQPRYPGQNPAPAQTFGSPQQASQTLSQAINGQSSAAFPNQQAKASASPGPALPPMPMAPPPPILPGTHPEIGFSALQVLPQHQHQQFLALAPQQQTDYSMQVFKSLSPEQQNHYTVTAQAQARLREKWNQQYAAQNPGMMVIPPRGGAPNPYAGYANQMPTQQQQAGQQRFPGQNPVFRVGAGGAQQPQQPQQPGQPGQNFNAQHQQYMMQQQQYFAQQQTSILAAMNPQQLEQFYALDPQTQHNFMLQQIQMRQEAQKRQMQQQQRLKQQAVMHKSHQAHQEKVHQSKATSGGGGGGRKKKRGKYDDSEEEEELHLHDDSEDDEDDDDDDVDDGDGSEAEAERESQAIKWFNEAEAHELMEMTACTPEAAAAVIEMRPYESPGDARVKLRKRKGVSGNLFDNYVELMHSYQQTDDCLASCKEIGEELLDIMSIWTGGKKIAPTASMRPSAEPEDEKDVVKTEGEASSAGDTLTVPDTSAGAGSLTAENTTNVGSNLVSMADDVLAASIGEDASPEVKAAFEDYLYQQPKGLGKDFKLKGYQMLGVNWLNLLYRKNISCILADEMGLGKTAQVIAFLAHLKEIGKPGPHLIIVPSSTLDNWIREFERFAPDMKVYAYYGNQAERADARFFLKQEADLDVIVTTYNMATGAPDDKKFLRKMEFKACVFDEGHQLKNAESKKYKDLMDIKVEWRLLLTGTPLQNNLQELVSLLSFILPKIFSDAQESLRAIFKVPPEAQKNLLTRQRVRAAKQVMTPFVLRRKKAQVLQDLPQKFEIVEYCDMTSAQREIYRETIAKHKKAVIEYTPSGTNTPAEEEKKPGPKKRGKAAAKTGKPVQENSTSNILMQLRKAANHPMLFRRLYDDKKIKQMAKDCLKEEEFHDRNVDYIYEDMDLMTDFELHRFVQPYKFLNKYGLKKQEWMDSGKVQKLKELLPGIKAKGDRVLIFSQFVQVLDIMAQVLQTMDIRYLTLTGQTNVNDRQGLVDQFTEDDDITCFLLSTRAGGLGLNLMAANVVIILDMDFNPHNDKQAQDRAYRMGQTKDVTIYKFVTRGTIEEDMLALANTKLALDQQVSSEAAISGEMAEKIEIDEGEEGVIEKKVKTSLLTTLKKRFEGDDDAYQATHPVAGEGDVDTKADGQIGENGNTTNPKIEVEGPEDASDLSSIPSAKTE